MGVDCAVEVTSVEASDSEACAEASFKGLAEAWQTTQAAKISSTRCMKMMVRKGAALMAVDG